MAAKWAFRVLPILLFVFSFVPRLVAIDRYVTPDEPTWVYRSILFREAIQDGDWSGTLVAGHPGVTTTWLGTLGISAQLFLKPELGEAYDWLTKIAYLTPDNVEAYKRLAVLLSSGRVAVAIVNSLGVVGVYLLARRLWGRQIAVIAGLFLAFDPFLAGLSGLLHVDGLSATFTTLSLLALALGLRWDGTSRATGRPTGWLIFSGAMAGLAILTKTPTLVLIPVTGLFFLGDFFRQRHRSLHERGTNFLSRIVAWGAAFLVIVLLLFPALWSTPAAVWSTVMGSANRHLDEALRQTFFLGEVAYNHGLLFYPVVLLWRLSPVVWLAFVAALWMGVRERRHGSIASEPNFPVLLLIVWVTFFLLAITPAAKKFDRYILPAVPSLLILIAVVWVSIATRLRSSGRWLLNGLVLLQVVFWVFFAAYPLAAYNPLVGGPITAPLVLPIGWGESIGAAGTNLSSSSTSVREERAISGIAPSLAPFFVGQTLVDGWDDRDTADYAIVTLGGLQLDPLEFEAQTRDGDLIQTVHYGGLDQAWVYEFEAPQDPGEPPDLTENVTFGDQIALVAYDQTVAGDAISIAARWRKAAGVEPDARYTLRIVIQDEQGNRWATQETDLLNEVYFFPSDWLDEETGIVRYSLELPPGIPPATYDITVALIDSRTGGRMPVRVGEDGFQGVEYDAGTIDVAPPSTIVSASRIQIENGDGTTWLNDRLQLLGYGNIAAEALAGSRMPVELIWHLPAGDLPEGMALNWHLIADDGQDRVIATEPLSRFDTALWRTGETIQEKYQVPLPPDLAPGHYELAVEVLRADGTSAGEAATLSGIQINNIDRLYDVPVDVPVSVDVVWEPLQLLGMEPESLVGNAGEDAELTLYWQKNRAHGEVFSVFLHVVDADGNIVLQADHWPGGLPTDILDNGQVVIDRVPLALPPDLPSGPYDIRVGVYSAESGQRLPILSGQVYQQDMSGLDSLILPVRLQVTNP